MKNARSFKISMFQELSNNIKHVSFGHHLSPFFLLLTFKNLLIKGKISPSETYS